jgi:NACHT domain
MCLDGTRIAELELIEKWAADSTTKLFYYLSGIAGSGKSTIAQTFAERCCAEGRLGASFFCSRNSQGRSNIRLIFPTLAYYLALKFPKFKSALIPIICDSPDIGQDSLAVQFEDLIICPLQLSKIHIIIIIDALDECEDKEPVSAILSVMARHIHKISSVKFLITGRPEPRIKSGFRLRSLRPHTEVFLLHEVDRSSVDQDIELYLRTHLSQIAEEGIDWDLTVQWPSNEEIMVATAKCGGLFIVASVMVKFIKSPYHKPRDRLRIISSLDSTVHEGRSGLDVMYDQVFLHSFDDVSSEDIESGFFDRLQIVVGSVVLAFDPLSRASLATILGITSEDVGIALRSLHSVFIIPESKSDSIRICHKSLADYLTDGNRCTDPRFHLNPSVFHLELGIRCLQSMNASLRKDICKIPIYAMNADIEDLGKRREECVGGGLEYACKSWARHLLLGPRDGNNVGRVTPLLKTFFSSHLLQWLEVLSIVGDLRCAVYSLHDVATWLVDVSGSLFLSSRYFIEHRCTGCVV